MRRLQDDDAGAFDEMYERYAVQAFRIARTVCPMSGAAEEAVQEGFISIWRGRGSYKPSLGSPSAWMMTVVRNRAVDVARHNAVRDGPRAEPELAERVPATVDVIADTVLSEDGRDLRKLLASLPDPQREVIALAYYGELSFTEVANHLGIPAGTVKGRMRLGLQKLNDQLAPSRSA